MNFRILPVAAADARDISARMEFEHRGYGTDFDLMMDAATTSIRSHPRQYPRTFDGPRQPETREYYIKRFEYRVIFALEPDETVILAVVHARSRPRSWRRRLRELR